MTQVNLHNENVWVTRAKLARHFAFSLRTVANLQKRRVLPYVKIGRLVRFNINKCEQALIQFERKSICDI
jgi:hypothetical protein